MSKHQDFNTRYFTTYDLGLSAALVAAEFTLDHLDKSMPGKVMFVFSRTVGLDTAIQNFWSRTFSVDAMTYFNALKLLKNRIYSD